MKSLDSKLPPRIDIGKKYQNTKFELVHEIRTSQLKPNYVLRSAAYVCYFCSLGIKDKYVLELVKEQEKGPITSFKVYLHSECYKKEMH